MNTRLPGNLAEIFPLRFRLREEMRFSRVGEVVVAEKVRSGQRYSLKPWQYDLLARFDGMSPTIGQAVTLQWDLSADKPALLARADQSLVPTP